MKKTNRIDRTSLVALSFVFILAAATIVQAVLTSSVQAAQISVRSLELQTSDLNVGGSTPGGVVDHNFTFTVPTSSPVGSIRLQYCTTPADVGVATCVAPTGLNATAATLGGQTGITGLTKANDTANSFHLTRSPGATVTPGANTVVTLLIKDITNPTAANETFFVRITTHLSFDGTDATPIDNGSVAASTATPIQLSGVMPESLVFCAGATVGVTSSVPDCATVTTGIVNFDQLFSPTDTAMAFSQMAASTNAGSGYAVTVNGPTLTSSGNTIAAIPSPTASIKGTSQFGMNIAANTVAAAPGFGLAPYFALVDPVNNIIAPLANGANYRGVASADYGTADIFKFVDNDLVASSSNAVLGPSDAQIFTVSYIANVPGSQAAGTYSTTLTYVCTPTY